MASLFTGGKFQAESSTGIVPGARLYSYAAGTTTPLATYTDQGGASPNTNPVVCDANGQADVWLGTSAYRMILKNASDVTIWDTDNISAPLAAAALSASSGSSLVGFIQSGTGAVARTGQSKFRDVVSVTDFGAVGDGVTDDTWAINSAYAAAAAAGAELVFPAGTWGVTSVTFGGSDVFIRFAGNSRLKGIATTSQAAVLQITGRQMVIFNLQVDQNFNTFYTKGAIWWNSVSTGVPAQYNSIFGLKVSNCVNGIVYGDVVGGSPVNAAQSENTIYGLRTRACQVPFVGNQPNGFITLVAPILDCNPNEWTSQSGYSDTTFQTAARCIWNPSAGSNHLTVIGGEIVKTTSTLGYGIVGGNINITAPNVIEIAGAQAYLDGGLSVSDCQNWAMTAGGLTTSTLNAFVLDPAAPATASLTLRNCAPSRTAAGSSASSTASFVAAASGSPAMPITIKDCYLGEWRWDSTVPLVSGCVLRKFDNNTVTVNTRGANTLVNQTPLGITAATGTVQGTDLEVVVNFAGTCTITLPAAASYAGKYLRFNTLQAQAVVSASSNVIPLGGTAAGTAILAATIGKWCEMQSDGTNWRILRAN